MRAQTIALIALVFVLLPASAEAAPTLFWGNPEYDPDTGELIPTSFKSIADYSDVAVPFGVSESVWVEPVPETAGIGVLYFVPSAGGPREHVVTFGGFTGVYELAWNQEGSYELDVYTFVSGGTVRSNTNRAFAWLLGERARAQSEDDYVGTIHFTIHNETPLSGAPSVLFIPGIKGSRLKTGTDTLWPPTVWRDDIKQLALTTEGESVHPVVVDGPLETFYGTPIYSGFTSFMDELVLSGTTTAWRSLPYDWRFSPEKILADGIKTPTDTIDPIEVVEALAAQSGTGKVVIVAHSMGGLLGKALIKKLEEVGKANLIESFVMVGTPQLGTPQAISALLHGDDESIIGGVVINRIDIRQVAKTMPGTYNLLPSPRYFADVHDAPITFAANAAFTVAWRDFWGPSLDTYTKLTEFITGIGVARTAPATPSRLEIPEILRADLVANAKTLHEIFDTYTIPSAIRVVQVAGWGALTTKAVRYRTWHFAPSYETTFTREGDGTVVYPSAISSIADETYYFNLFDYNETFSPDVTHRNLLTSLPVQSIISSIIDNTEISNAFLTTARPPLSDIADLLTVSTHSPVILGAYDQNGHFTGINPNQDLNAEVLTITEDIPGGTFFSSGDSQYLFLPKGGTYTFSFKGIGVGPTTVDIESLVGDVTSPIVSYIDIPVTSSTSATFVVDSVAPQEVHIQIDINNDGVTDTFVAPEGQTLTLGELLTNLKTAIQNLTTTDKIKTNLLKKVANIEKKVAKQKAKKASKVVANIEKQINKKALKGKVSDVEAADILKLLEQVENAL